VIRQEISSPPATVVSDSTAAGLFGEPAGSEEVSDDVSALDGEATWGSSLSCDATSCGAERALKSKKRLVTVIRLKSVRDKR
jgi:hypothetical protein